MSTNSADVADTHAEVLLERVREPRRGLAENFRDDLVQAMYDEAQTIADRAVTRSGDVRIDWDQRIDRLLTSSTFGLPLMLALLGIVFWITIVGANYPTQMLATMLFEVENTGGGVFETLRARWWLTGFARRGV